MEMSSNNKSREVSLREPNPRPPTDPVCKDVEMSLRERIAEPAWPANERLLVCVGPSPTSARVVRAAKRLSDRIDAEWIALHVETLRALRMSESDRQRLHQHLRLAESLGAEIIQISGEHLATELIEYAGSRNVTKIVVGKTDPHFHRQLFGRSLVERLVRDSGNIDIFVVCGVDEPVMVEPPSRSRRLRLSTWLGTLLLLGAATLVALVFNAVGFTEANLVMIYLLAVVFVAARFGALQSAVTSFAAVLLFNVLFTTPYYQVTVHDTQYLFTFSVMLVVGLLASMLTVRVRYQAEVARRNERRMEALYRLSRRLIAISDRRQLVDEVERTVAEVFDVHAVVFLPDEDRRIRPIIGHPATFAAGASECAAAQWVFDHNQMAGTGTNTQPGTTALYVPMATPNGVIGVLAVQAEGGQTQLSPDVQQLLDTYATQIAFAIERDQLARQSQQAELQIETEKMRSSLLSAVSHDLRTPLAAIAGAGSSLAQAFESLAPHTRAELLETICDESDRLSRLVENLLHMTRLSGGRIDVNRQWQPVDEVIGSALNRMGPQLHDHPINIDVPDDLPLGQFDDVLIEQLLVNLLDNAVKYSDEASPIEIRAEPLLSRIAIEVSDRGRGLIEGDQQRVFDMFYRGADAKPDRRGTGLGLAICKAIVTAHGGTIQATNRPGGGTIVCFELPYEGSPPKLDIEEAE